MGADILLAECSGQGWLVRGDQYIDDLLANTLAPHVTVEVVTCESKSAIDQLRLTVAGPEDTEATMWLIHPAVIRRARGQVGDMSIDFPDWSAALSADALQTIQMAADTTLRTPDADLSLTSYAVPDASPMAAAMTELRCGMVQSHLVSLGVEIRRIIRETRDATKPEQGNRLDLAIQSAEAAS